MSTQAVRPWIVTILLIGLLSLISACAAFNQIIPGAADPTPTLPPGEKILIATNTQAEYADLRIGAGNFWEEEYTNAAGETTKGLTAGLWLFLRDHPEESQSVRVYPGQTLDFGPYRLVVMDVVDNWSETYVALAVQTAE